MTLLLHICCGPCTFIPAKRLQELKIPFKGYFYNPNINPLTEYLARRQAVEQVANLLGFTVLLADSYPLEDFLWKILPNPEKPKRCEICYYLRLSETAKRAKDLGFSAISTTLLFSPFQFHELIREIGEEVGQKWGLKFFYEDFRGYYQEGKRLAIEAGIYRQKYCGCIFSEKERFLKKLSKWQA